MMEYPTGNSIVLQQVPSFLQDTIASIIAFLPLVLSALVILVVGYVIGRVLESIITRIIVGVGLSKYTQGTPLHNLGDGDGGLARALGKLAAYYVYFLALLAAADVLNIEVLSGLLSDLGTFIPVILSALVILVVGFVVGRVVGDLVEDLIGGFGFDGYLRETPLEGIARPAGGLGGIIGTLAEYYIYFLTLLTAAGVLGIPALSRLLNDFAGFVPALIGGVLVLVVGVLIAEFVEDIVASTDTSRLTDLVGLGVKLFVYYIAITIALDTVGFDTAVLTNLFTVIVTAFFGALAVALALAVGIGVGWGSKDYVADNIDDWMRRARRESSFGDEGTGGSTRNNEDMFDDDDRGPSGTGGPGPTND